MQIHLKPTAPLAERVLLPGDPGRALRLAQSLLEDPRMFNHERGLWGYTGTASDGRLLTIQSTGMGGPSAAIVVTELADLGAQTLIRVGTCGALDASLQLGTVVVVSEALAMDGTSRALGASERVAPEERLLRAFESGKLRAVRAASSDLFYGGGEETLREAGGQVVDMESATLLALAPRLQLEAASVLIVSDLVFPHRQRISADALVADERRAGALAARALSLVPARGG